MELVSRVLLTIIMSYFESTNVFKTSTFSYLLSVSTVLRCVVLTSTYELRNNELARIKVTLFRIFEILRQKPVFRGPHLIKADRKDPQTFLSP